MYTYINTSHLYLSTWKIPITEYWVRKGSSSMYNMKAFITFEGPQNDNIYFLWWLTRTHTCTLHINTKPRMEKGAKNVCMTFCIYILFFLKGKMWEQTGQSLLILILWTDKFVPVTLLFACLKCFLIQLNLLNLKTKSVEKACSPNAAFIRLRIFACHISALSGILRQKEKG